MAKNDFPKVKPAEAYPLGHAKDNKPADVYAKNGTSLADMKNAVEKTGNWTNELDISLAAGSKGNVKGINPYGTGTMRGYGAATKGRKISGKMG
jgi:hypothetical protein